jgi:hypothetical protein
MLLRRRKYKKSRASTYSIALISLAILACEIWYLEAHNTRNPKSSRMAISQELIANNISTVAYLTPATEPGGTAKLLTFSSPFDALSALGGGEDKGGGDPLPFSGKKEISNLAHILESVCIGSNPCASINVAQLHAKEAK